MPLQNSEGPNEGNQNLAEADRLTRYIFQSSHIGPKSSPTYVKGAAFEPPKGNLKTSVQIITNATNDEIWDEGRRQHDPRREHNPRFYGRGDFIVESLRRLELDAIEEGPKDHAHIVGWADDKSIRMRVAKQLAAEVAYLPNPDEKQGFV